MHARKKKMIELADVYLALPGGPGTLEEISEVISWGRVGEHMNPCILYNVNGYYDLLAAFFDKMVETNFLTAADRAKIFISDSLELFCPSFFWMDKDIFSGPFFGNDTFIHENNTIGYVPRKFHFMCYNHHC